MWHRRVPSAVLTPLLSVCSSFSDPNPPTHTTTAELEVEVAYATDPLSSLVVAPVSESASQRERKAVSPPFIRVSAPPAEHRGDDYDSTAARLHLHAPLSSIHATHGGTAVDPVKLAWESAATERRLCGALRQPFCLSRLAAWKAMAHLHTAQRERASTGSSGVVEPRRPPPSPQQLVERLLHPWQPRSPDQGEGLSLSHEEHVAAAVAWRCHSTRSSPPPKSSLAFAIDVVDLCAIHRLARQYPHFTTRMLPPLALLPPLVTGMVDPAYHDIGVAPPTTAAAVSSSSSTESDPKKWEGGNPWWYAAMEPAVKHCGEATHSVALAQHWGVRECCIKLMGLPQRSFHYGHLSHGGQAVAPSPVSEGGPFAAPLPAGLMRPYQVYRSECDPSSEDGVAMRHAGLSHVLYTLCWLEWIQLRTEKRKRREKDTHSSSSDSTACTSWRPYVVTVASCSYRPQ